MFDAALLDSTSGWLASSSDLVRLFEALSAAATTTTSRSTAAAAPLLAPPIVRAMLERRAPAAGGDDRTSTAWYGLGLVVEDGGRTFWHSGTLDGSTAVVVRDGDVGVTWAALVNRRLAPHNDLWDFMRYAVRRVFGTATPTASPHPSSASSSPAAAADADADPSWLEQRDRSVSDHSDVLGPEVQSGTGGGGGSAWVMRQAVDSLSRDRRTAVKLMVPSYRVSDAVSTVVSAGYRPTWLDAVVYRGRVFFNVIFTRNDEQLRSSPPAITTL